MSSMPHMGAACHRNFPQYQPLVLAVEYGIWRVRDCVRMSVLASLGANACKV